MSTYSMRECTYFESLDPRIHKSSQCNESAQFSQSTESENVSKLYRAKVYPPQCMTKQKVLPCLENCK